MTLFKENILSKDDKHIEDKHRRSMGLSAILKEDHQKTVRQSWS